tara:strand:+ start:2203 stop:2349 length:147 start_codon:yes stop_codon:yes gene_type:complete
LTTKYGLALAIRRDKKLIYDVLITGGGILGASTAYEWYAQLLALIYRT